MPKKLSALIVATALGALMTPAVALADTAVIGSALTLPYQGGVSTGDTTTLQQTQGAACAESPHLPGGRCRHRMEGAHERRRCDLHPAHPQSDRHRRHLHRLGLRDGPRRPAGNG